MNNLTPAQKKILENYKGELPLTTMVTVSSIKGDSVRLKDMMLGEFLVMDKDRSRQYRSYQLGTCTMKQTE